MNDRATNEPEALGTLIARVYPDLQRIAAAKAAGSRCSPSSLAQETVCRLLKLPEPPASEDAVRAVGYKLMEWTLLDRLRSDSSRRAREAGSADPERTAHEPQQARLERLSEALVALAELSPRKAEVMTLSAVCGMTMDRIAESMGIHPKMVQRDLTFARAWIASRLGRDGDVQRNGQNGHA